MRITLAIFAFVSVVATLDEGVIRAPIIRNHNWSNTLALAKKRYQHISRRKFDKRDSFTASLYNDQGSQYLVEVNIGTPAQKFVVTLDTGSADLWVPSNNCPARECPFSRFNPSNSSSYKSLEAPFNIQYGIGSVNGTYVTDTVSLGGATINNQQLGLATSSKDILFADESDGKTSHVDANGILGLGYPSLTQANSQGEGPYNPFVFNLVSQKLISEPVFSIYLNSITQTGWSGEIILGGIDNSKYSGELNYLPVATLSNRKSGGVSGSGGKYYYWMVYGQGLGVKNATHGSNPYWRLKEMGAFILDTGTTLTYLPTSVATEIVTAFAGPNGFSLDRSSGVFAVDCDASKSPARFELQMSNSNSFSNQPLVVSVPASQLVIPLDSNDPSTASACMFGIAPLGGSGSIGSNMYLVGDSVLRSTYMVFDMGANRVGLASSKGVSGTVTVANSTLANTTHPSSSSSATSSGSGTSNIAFSAYKTNIPSSMALSALAIIAFTMATF
ncbi:aspartic peptidase domain-containing protein [Sporodiniella umbellata]|nr:aspartic peptidase domain-containing protein [Sporodiniella umbellata]